MSNRAISVTLVLLLLVTAQGCSDERKPATDSQAQSQAQAPRSDVPTPREGGYELAEVLAWAMPAAAAGATSALPSLQDYNRFKGVVSNITRAEGGAQYIGKVVPLADGKRIVPDNIEDDYSWRVWIDGPQAGADSIRFGAFEHASSDSLELGPAYLRRHGFDLVALTCFSSGGTPNNAEAMYLVRFPGKVPTLMNYLVSTGSRGVSHSWQVHYGYVDWKDVPGATEADYRGARQQFAQCDFESLR